MKTTAEKIEVMKAYEEGKKIEAIGLNVDSIFKEWTLIEKPSWNWQWYDYRIAEKKYRPYKDTEEMINDFCKRSGAKRSNMGEPFIWIKDKDYTKLITVFDEHCCSISGIYWYMEEIYNKFTYLDGSPCGILEN